MSLREAPRHISLPAELEVLRGTGREQDVSTGAWTDTMAGALDWESKMRLLVSLCYELAEAG